jgi:hypothetical protein
MRFKLVAGKLIEFVPDIEDIRVDVESQPGR